MSRISDNDIDEMLKQGLRNVPAPEVSADFDSRVRAGLRRPQSLWQILWSFARPTLAPACLSLAVTLAVLIVSGAPRPDATARTRIASPGNIALGSRPERLRTLDQDIERLDHETPSLGGFTNSRREAPASQMPEPQLPGRRGASSRQAASAGLNA